MLVGFLGIVGFVGIFLSVTNYFELISNIFLHVKNFFLITLSRNHFELLHEDACSTSHEQYNSLHLIFLKIHRTSERSLPILSTLLMPTAQLKNAIRRLRFERNMTQEELALRTGVSRQTIMSIERGRTNPSVLLAYKIASALSADVTEVFTMEGKLAPV
jgi:putative transcriptional regulator